MSFLVGILIVIIAVIFVTNFILGLIEGQVETDMRKLYPLRKKEPPVRKNGHVWWIYIRGYRYGQWLETPKEEK